MAVEFESVSETWRRARTTLRQVVRQEVVARQLREHLFAGEQKLILDVGCGQGNQMIRLARRGHKVIGVDSCPGMLRDVHLKIAADREGPDLQEHVSTVHADAIGLSHLFEAGSFDAVLCHGVLMYYPNPEPFLDTLAHLVKPGGLVSVLTRNGDALALRPALRGAWEDVGSAFAATTYFGSMGVVGHAVRRQEMTSMLATRGLHLECWYGVRVLTDHLDFDAPMPDTNVLQRIVRHEERAGRTDPYRGIGSLLHYVARREDYPHEVNGA